MNHWIHQPYNDSHIAYQCLDIGGYIPFAPFGGQHIMDDFGNLIETCARGYQDMASQPSIGWRYEPFFTR